MNDKIIILNQKVFYWIYISGISLITALPFLTLPILFHPPDWGKAIVFRIIISILLFIFVVQISYQKEYRLFIYQKIKSIPKWFLFPFILFIVLLLVSTFLALEPFFSFWGSPYRAGGALNLLLYLTLAIFSYLVIEKKDWKKIWVCAIITGLAVSFIAIAQQFWLIKESILVFYSNRPPATLGSANFLAAYLILLSILTFVFGVKEKKTIKKGFYLVSSFVFVFIILLTISRAGILGIFLGIFWFFFFIKSKNYLWNKLKIFLIVLLLIFLFLLFLFANNPALNEKVQKNKIVGNIVNRFTVDSFISDIRIAGWKMGWQALKDRPLLGYGPENFSIGFDKYYDPSLPQLPAAGERWWDRAHNFLLEIGVTMGIPALLTYLFFWLVLFLKLQKIKKERPSEYLIPHALQATFVAFFVNNLFNFDCVPTYIISYLLIGYSLHLISSNTAEVTLNKTQNNAEKFGVNQRNDQRNFSGKNNLYKSIPLVLIGILLIWFIWQYNLKPILINREINRAVFYSQNKKCEAAFAIMEKILPSHSFIDHYLRSQYIEIIKECLKANPQLKTEFSLKAIQIIDETIKLRPQYTRSWLFLGSYINLFVEDNDKIDQPLKEEFLKKADYSFKRASELSPKRQEIYIGWINTALLSGKYANAEQKAEKCISLYPGKGECWWLKGLSNLLLDNPKQFEEDVKMANQKRFDISAEGSLLQLLKAYSILIQGSNGNKTEYYLPLVDIYQKLIVLNPKSFQYHASLAYVYKMLGNYKEARAEALAALELSPESKASVEEFLRTLPPK